jgi:glutamate synthase domain-containing protein 3
MRTGRDVAIAAILGAEEFGFATAALVVLGCVMLRHCNLNNCSVGIATQDEILERRFQGRPEHLINYFYFVAEELRQIMADLGLRTVDELVGRTDLLEFNTSIILTKSGQIDFSRILYQPPVLGVNGRHCTSRQAHGIDNVLDLKLMDLAKNAIDKAEAVKIELPITNTDRASGAMLSAQVCRRWGEEGFCDDTIYCKFSGSAGQSFAAWLSRGVTFELEGMANDYVGKGVSGGKVIIYPSRRANFEAARNIIIGNTAFYGAISGEAYIRGVAGERFCIRNSGLQAVVEGVGDHGCEYMTGGKVVVIGRTGRNFAAGMSGGIAYVYDVDKKFNLRCNLGMVDLESISVDDAKYIYRALHDHYRYTHSEAALKIMDNFERDIRKFIKVMPLEYKRILESKAQDEQMELTEVSDG